MHTHTHTHTQARAARWWYTPTFIFQNKEISWKNLCCVAIFAIIIIIIIIIVIIIFITKVLIMMVCVIKGFVESSVTFTPRSAKAMFHTIRF
jgi:hypothetical protein